MDAVAATRRLGVGVAAVERGGTPAPHAPAPRRRRPPPLPADPGAAAPPPRATPYRANAPARGQGPRPYAEPLARTRARRAAETGGALADPQPAWASAGQAVERARAAFTDKVLFRPASGSVDCLAAPSAHAAPASAPTYRAAGAQAERLLAELETLSALVGPLSLEAFPWMPHPVPDRAAPAVPSADAAAEAGADAGAGECEGARPAASPEPLSHALHASVRAELPGRGVVALLAGPP
jgi:hypothetical protein